MFISGRDEVLLVLVLILICVNVQNSQVLPDKMWKKSLVGRNLSHVCRLSSLVRLEPGAASGAALSVITLLSFVLIFGRNVSCHTLLRVTFGIQSSMLLLLLPFGNGLRKIHRGRRREKKKERSKENECGRETERKKE